MVERQTGSDITYLANMRIPPAIGLGVTRVAEIRVITASNLIIVARNVRFEVTFHIAQAKIKVENKV